MPPVWIAIVTAIVFLPAIGGGFVNTDDPHYVQRNPLVLGVVTQQGFQSRADRFTYIPNIGLMVAIV